MSDFIERIAQSVQVQANARQVYGEPVERDGTTIIPVARVQWGFGGGTMGQGPIERGGGGGGAQTFPVGYIEVREGKAEFRPIPDPNVPIKLAAVGIGALLGALLVAKLTRR